MQKEWYNQIKDKTSAPQLNSQFQRELWSYHTFENKEEKIYLHKKNKN